MQAALPFRSLRISTLLLFTLASPCAVAESDAPLPTIAVADSATDAAEQIAEPAPTAKLDSIIVTGEKLGRTLDETMTSVTALSGRTLEDYGDESLTDLAERMVGVSVSNEGDISIRGVSWGGAEGFGAGQPVITTYVDGVAVDEIAQNGNVLNLFDVDQVEILRGAQSTSQGRNALAGAVVINTREPTPYWDLLARARYGELGERQLAVAGGGPISERLSFRLSADAQHSDGFITNTTLDDPHWNERDDYLVRGKLSWAPGDGAFSALLTLGATRRNGGANGVNREANEDGDSARRTATDDFADDNSQDSLPMSLRLRMTLADGFDLTSTAGYIRTDGFLAADYDQSEKDNGTYRFDTAGRTLSQELRLNIEDWNRFTGVIGLFAGRARTTTLYNAYDFPTQLGEVLPLPVLGELIEAQVDYTLNNGKRAENVAAFAEFDYALSERLTLVAGLRYDREEGEVDSEFTVTAADTQLATPDQLVGLDPILRRVPGIPSLILYRRLGVVPGTNGIQRAGATYDALLPKIGLRYAVTPALTLFAHYTEAYRAGGADINVQNGVINDYDPEYTRTFETGLRLHSFSGQLRTQFNLYHTQWVDQQVSVYDPESEGYYTENAADSTLYGGELENNLRIGTAWQLYANVGYSRTRFNDYVTAEEDYSGNDFFDAPRWTGSTGLVWRGASGWFGSAAWAFTDSAWSTPSNSPRENSDARRLVGARLGYETKRWSIYGYGRNLLDEDYSVYRFEFFPGFGREPGRAIGYGSPRVIGLQLEWRWS